MLHAMLRIRYSNPTQARRIAGLGLAALLAMPVLAAPADYAPLPPAAAAASAADVVSRFLVEKGLIAPAAAASMSAGPGFVAQVRDKASDMVLTAMNFLGVPYRRGGNSAEQGFDCSGFTRHVFESSLGLLLPRRADEQATTAGLLNIKRNELKPGDLVFFNTLRRTFSHVGIYVGEGRFIHAPRPGGEVRVEDMGTTYWSTRFTGARRADTAADVVPTTPSVQADPAPATPPVATLRNVY